MSFVDVSFHFSRVYIQEWNMWVIGLVALVRIATHFLKCLYPFTPPEMCEIFSCSTSSPVLDIAHLLNFSRCGNCVVVFPL